MTRVITSSAAQATQTAETDAGSHSDFSDMTDTMRNAATARVRSGLARCQAIVDELAAEYRWDPDADDALKSFQASVAALYWATTESAKRVAKADA